MEQESICNDCMSIWSYDNKYIGTIWICNICGYINDISITK